MLTFTLIEILTLCSCRKLRSHLSRALLPCPIQPISFPQNHQFPEMQTIMNEKMPSDIQLQLKPKINNFYFKFTYF